MIKNNFKKLRNSLTVLLVIFLTSSLSAVSTQPADAQMDMPMSDLGIVCTTSDTATFTLTTKSGTIMLPDDNTMFMWGFAEGDRPFQHPSPVLCVNQGDTVTIILKNTFDVDVSIMFPGQENVLANGVPVQPQYDGVTGELTSLTNVAPANGGSVTYQFVANSPGSFIYQSGTNPDIQVRMGLFGAIVVNPAIEADPAYAGRNFANNRLDSEYNEEFLIFFSEIDPYLNQAVERGLTFDFTNYHPRYWLINGRGFPDTIAPNYASWLPNQPYGSLVRVHPYDEVHNPLPSLERFINVGSEIVPMHPHGKNAVVINQDGRAVEGPGGEELSWENYSLPVAPGQAYDGLFNWEDKEKYDPVDNPIPVTIPEVTSLVYGMFYSGSPYLGTQDTLPVGHSGMNMGGEYYLISHNHSLYQITSWGVVMTGPVTYLRVDPPTWEQ